MRVPALLVAVPAFLDLARPPGAGAEGVEREIVVRGETRSYLIHVPATWNRSRPLPVLFVFHGTGSDAESMVRATGFDALSDAEPMLVVYPRATGRVKRYEVDPPAGRTSADVELVDAILARLRERFPLDARRIWATGFSNGAALCYRLLVEGKGHEWSGGPGGTISRAILDFLTQHPQAGRALPGPAANRLVGTRFGSLNGLRWLAREGGPVSVAVQPLTLLRWWTNACPHCVASVPVLARLEERYRARGLKLVAVYHPKGMRLGDEAARAHLQGLGFQGAIAFDDHWTKYIELRDRGGLRQATSISVLVDAGGIVRWVNPGPRIEAGSSDLAALDALLDRLLPPAAPQGATPLR